MAPARNTLVILGSLWVLAISAGFFVLMKYENTAGVAAVPPNSWPHKSQIRLSPNRATLVMLAHPQCPCTRASISELAQLMSRRPDKLRAYVLFLSPGEAPAGWERTDLWQSAAAIPGVTVLRDIEGTEALRFKSTTSGQTLVYGPEGQLLFSGGITAARGRIGDNMGLRTVISNLDRKPVGQQTASVFGCSLITPVENQ